MFWVRNLTKWEGERKIRDIEDLIYEIASFIADPKQPSEDVSSAILQLWSARRIYNELHVEYGIPNIRQWQGIKYDVNEYLHVGAKGRPFKVKTIRNKNGVQYECAYLYHPSYPIQKEDLVSDEMLKMISEEV